jgi:hypothetical protein
MAGLNYHFHASLCARQPPSLHLCPPCQGSCGTCHILCWGGSDIKTIWHHQHLNTQCTNVSYPHCKKIGLQYFLPNTTKRRNMPPITFPAVLPMALLSIAGWYIIVNPLPSSSSSGPRGKFAGAPSVAARLATGDADMAVLGSLPRNWSTNRNQGVSTGRRAWRGGRESMGHRRVRDRRR